MKPEIFAARLAKQLHCPPLEEAWVTKNPELIPRNIHLVWRGRKTRNMYGLIQHDQKLWYVQKLIHNRFFDTPQTNRIVCLCQVPLCVNPHHWEGSAWTLQDVQELLSELPLSSMPEDIPKKLLMEAIATQ